MLDVLMFRPVNEEFEHPWGETLPFETQFYIAELPSSVYSGIGRDITGFRMVEIYWMSTKEHPHPETTWLQKNFPDPDSSILHLRRCLQDYHATFDEEWKAVVRNEICPVEDKVVFDREGILPLVSFSCILINPTANVIDYRFICPFEPNSVEHGLHVVYMEGDFKYLHEDDVTDYFEWWNRQSSV
jgi:hypothetical protein